MLRLTMKSIVMSGVTAMVTSGLLFTGATAVDAATTSTAAGNDQQRLTTIISKGNQEISRRLTTLNELNTKIAAATKLTSSDKASLTNEVNAEITGLTALKEKLDNDTTLSDARSDAQSIFTEYRVYALVAPKVTLIKTADDQQVAETKLTTLIQKLQTRITNAKNSGKDVTALQNALNDMTTKVSSAQGISSSIEQKVIGLQPSDYNSDHALLSGDRDQLKTAHSDNEAAYADAKTIVQGL